MTAPVKERGILFKGRLVRRILAGEKTQTRRMLKPQPAEHEDPRVFRSGSAEPQAFHCPQGRPGDRLWVRETFQVLHRGERAVRYHADDSDGAGLPWTPSIFMPRWASRVTLEITEVRVQRLQEICEEDAKAEGVMPLPCSVNPNQLVAGDPVRTFGTHPYSSEFAVLWDSINAERGSWSSNPWVWAITFKRVPR